jgi:hypothetical protein
VCQEIGSLCSLCKLRGHIARHCEGAGLKKGPQTAPENEPLPSTAERGKLAQSVGAVIGAVKLDESKPFWRCLDMLIHGVDDSIVVVLDSGAEVNYLASRALKDKGVILTPTDIRLFRVDRTPLEGAVVNSDEAGGRLVFQHHSWL